MKRSSVQRVSEGLVSPLSLSLTLPQFLCLYVREGGREGGRSGTSPCPAFEVWEVKITGTASRLNRRFHLSGRIKAPAAGTHTPYSPLTSIPSPHPPLFPSAPLNPSTKALGFLFSTIKEENIAELLNYSKNKSSGECRLYHERKDPVVGICVH